VVLENWDLINFGFMTFRQTGYHPYFKATTAVTTTPRPAFLTRNELEFAGCWSPTAGPSGSCTINYTTYTLATSNNSRYSVNRGTYFSTHDNSWSAGCNELCPITGVGTGRYIGSNYTFPFATAGVGTLKRFDDYVGRTRVDGVDTYVHLDAPRTKRNVNNIFGDEINDDTVYGLSYTNISAIVDPNRFDMMDTSLALPTANALSMARKISAQAEKVSLGGLYPYGGTSSGTSLKAAGVDAIKERSAYHYMEWVKNQNAANGVTCRPNSILFVTDGRPGNGDTNCDHSDCALSPPGPGCSDCLAVLNARSIRQTLGVTVYVIGFSGTVSSVADQKSINNIAKAGGSPAYPPGCTGAACKYAYFATSEADLKSVMRQTSFDTARGSYSTSPASGSSGTQNINGITPGTLLLDTRVDFPSWKGNVIAYDLSGASPTLAWSAAAVAFNKTADPNFWKKRNVWTSETVGSTTYMIKVQVDQTTGAILNKTKLTSLGLGATDAESELVARWMLGDPALGNPAVLGALVNSTPIDVGPPGTGTLPGAAAYFNGSTQKTRPFLTYVGSSDGMLHAFVSKSGMIGTQSYQGGQEAFAYIPQNMLKVIKRLYVQGGQLADPRDHIFGLASSPKVKTVCTSSCTDAATATWKTLLTMTEGYGGNDLFVLDISEPHTTTGIRSAINDPPVKRLEWHSDYLTSHKADYDARLGKTISVPAFYLNNTSSLDDYRMLFASGYGDGVNPDQGKYLVSVNASTGAPVDWQKPINVTSCAGNPGLDHALLTDVAVSRRFDAGQNAQLASAYFGDPWGQLWRYTPKGSTKISTAATFGCSHPLHFAPAVVQLDRDNAANRSGETYLVQVTNSALDPVTAYPTYPASKMVFTLDKRTGDDIAADNFVGGASQITLTAGIGSELCAVTGAAGSCTTPMPANARPTATPLAVLKEDGSGFQVITLWYVAGPGGCTKGSTYLTIHELRLTTAAVTQKYGGLLSNEPVTSAAFVGNKLVFADATGAKDVSNYTGMPTFKPAPPGTYTSTERVRRVMWMELP